MNPFYFSIHQKVRVIGPSDEHDPIYDGQEGTVDDIDTSDASWIPERYIVRFANGHYKDFFSKELKPI